MADIVYLITISNSQPNNNRFIFPFFFLQLYGLNHKLHYYLNIKDAAQNESERESEVKSNEENEKINEKCG